MEFCKYFEDCLVRKRRDDEEKKRLAELEQQQFTLAELQRQLAGMNAAKFDAGLHAMALFN
jgi:hypothetical protein